MRQQFASVLHNLKARYEEFMPRSVAMLYMQTYTAYSSVIYQPARIYYDILIMGEGVEQVFSYTQLL